jgi:MFS family permease
MKRVPVEYSATFVSISQSAQYFSAILAPLIGTYLSEHIGISGALLVSSAVRLIGFALFAIPNRTTSKKLERPPTDKV